MFYSNLLLNLLVGASLTPSSAFLGTQIDVIPRFQNEAIIDIQTKIPEVPFYSQFKDMGDIEWQKNGCGIASLAMVINFYHPGIVTVNNLLKAGIAAEAYLEDAGWKHDGLVLLAGKYDLKGSSYDLSNLDIDTAFSQFKMVLKNGPVIASVHYKFDPKSSIPHLVVINGIDGNTIYYNDPAGASAGEKISTQDFIKAWKKRFIVVRS